jgi:hypothetical protein
MGIVAVGWHRGGAIRYRGSKVTPNPTYRLALDHRLADQDDSLV